MCLDELAATAFYANEMQEGLDACNKLLSLPKDKIPESEIERWKTNREQYIQAIRNQEQAIKEHKKAQKEMNEKYGYGEKVENSTPKKKYKKRKKK